MPLTDLLGKNLNVCCCISIIKRQVSTPPTPSDDLHRPFPSTPSCLPLYLKRFTSLNFSNPAAAAPDSSLPSVISSSASASTSDYDGDVEVEGEASTPDFSSVYASPRLFFSSPGLSNSIMDSASFTSADEEEEEEVRTGEAAVAVHTESAVAVHTDSPDPYSDFRRSMEEMVDARELHDVPAHWESLQELLLRYLSLNPEPNHKFIAGAFADVLVSLMSPPSNGSVSVSGGAVAGCSS